MPSSPGGITKSFRIQTIIDILNRAGCLDKVELLQRLSTSLSVEKNELERAMYRDLEDLVKDNKIHVFSRDSLGKIVENETEETKKFKKYWHTEKFSPFDVQGNGLLKNIGAEIICNKQITSYLRISEFDRKKDNVNLNQIFIHIYNELFILTIDKIVYPLKIIIARKAPVPSIVIGKIYKNYGKKVALILLPEQIISSIKEDNLKGEFVVDCDSDSVSIQNENKKIVRHKSFNMASDLNLLIKAQKTRSKLEIDSIDKDFTTTESIQINNLQRPFVIRWTSSSIIFT